ncbi:response regulator [Haladaptatus sp. R4]|uniref:PAS domain-containing response regulator n=1 Tax=Haladaptatus sp. R4 TaxID=1679489 RepID=UPI0021008BE2|nr:response regulator [Haladaptatus sp. R4]
MAPIAVLHVDDDPDVLDLAATSLEGKSNQLRLRTASSGDDALSILREGGIDCVVSEYEIPDTTGLSLLESVREEFPDLPFILFTDTGSETIASRAISAGVTDYLQKGISTDGYAILANRIESVVHSARTERALQESEERYRTVVEGSHDAVYIYQDDRFAFVNERACEITGYTDDELRGMDVWSLLHPDDHDRVQGHRRESDERHARGFDLRRSVPNEGRGDQIRELLGACDDVSRDDGDHRFGS